jgi:hypothetical protein
MRPVKANYPFERLYRLRGFGSLAVVWLLCFVGMGLALLGIGSYQAAPQVVNDTRASAVAATHLDQPGLKPIETIHVGDRVITPGTDRNMIYHTEVDPQTWKRITLKMWRAWEDGTRDDVEVETLQSPEWINQQNIHVGGKTHLPVDLVDLDEPDAAADVVAVDPCPQLSEGRGRVVLTTINHLNNFVFDLRVRAEGGKEQLLEVTGWHKLFSTTRNDWVSVSTLAQSEQLQGRDRPLTVVALARKRGINRVYNMTVEDEHVYYVSALNLLAHNAGCIDPRTGQPIGRFIGDDKGNVMIEPVGGRTKSAGRGGVDTHTTYPNGSNYQRLNPQGHANDPTPHAHGHDIGTGPNMGGQGPSLDPIGNQVPFNSPDAHWPTH